MFIKEMVSAGWTEEEAEADLKMIAVPRLPASGDLTADAWQDTITDMENLTLETKMMGGINGYGISAYTKCPNASLAFVQFAADYEQVVRRNEMLGITPARADAAAFVGESDPTVQTIFDRLDGGCIDIMPAINAVSQLWTPSESFFVDLATDALSENRGEPTNLRHRGEDPGRARGALQPNLRRHLHAVVTRRDKTDKGGMGICQRPRSW